MPLNPAEGSSSPMGGVVREKAIRLQGAEAKKALEALEQELLRGDLLSTGAAHEPSPTQIHTKGTPAGIQIKVPEANPRTAQYLSILDIAQLRAEEQVIAKADEASRMEQEDVDRIETLRRKRASHKTAQTTIETDDKQSKSHHDGVPLLNPDTHRNFIRHCTQFEGSVEASRALLNKMDSLIAEQKHKRDERRMARLDALRKIREHYHDGDITAPPPQPQGGPNNSTKQPIPLDSSKLPAVAKRKKKLKGPLVLPRLPTIMDAIAKGLTAEAPIPMPDQTVVEEEILHRDELTNVKHELTSSESSSEGGTGDLEDTISNIQTHNKPTLAARRMPSNPPATAEIDEDEEDDDFTFTQWIEHMRAHGRYTALDAEVDEAAEALISERERAEAIKLLQKGMMGREEINYPPMPAIVGRRTHHIGLGNSRLGNTIARSVSGGAGTDPLTAVLRERAQRHGTHTGAMEKAMLRDTSNYVAIMQLLRQEGEELMRRGYVGAKTREMERQQKKANRKRRKELEKKEQEAFEKQNKNFLPTPQLPPLLSIEGKTQVNAAQDNGDAILSEGDGSDIPSSDCSSMSTTDSDEPMSEAEKSARAAQRRRQISEWLIGDKAMAIGKEGDSALRSIQEASRRARNEIEKRNARNRLTMESWTQTLPPQAIAVPVAEDDATKRRRLRKEAEAKARLINAHTAALTAGGREDEATAMAKVKDLPAHMRLKMQRQLKQKGLTDSNDALRKNSIDTWREAGDAAEVEAFLASTNATHTSQNRNPSLASLLPFSTKIALNGGDTTTVGNQHITSIAPILLGQLAKILHELQELPRRQVMTAIDDLSLEEQILIYRHKVKEQQIHLGLQRDRIDEVEGYLTNTYKRLQLLCSTANVAGRSMASEAHKLTTLTAKAMTQNERLWKRIENLIYVARAAARGAKNGTGMGIPEEGDEDFLLSAYGTSFTKKLQKWRRRTAVLQDLLAKKESECLRLQEDYQKLEHSYVLLFVSSGGMGENDSNTAAIKGMGVDASLLLRPKMNLKVFDEVQRLRQLADAMSPKSLAITNSTEASSPNIPRQAPGGKTFQLFKDVMRMPMTFGAVPKEGCGLRGELGDNTDAINAKNSTRETIVQRQVTRDALAKPTENEEGDEVVAEEAALRAPYTRVGVREAFIALAERQFLSVDNAVGAMMGTVASAMEAFHGRDFSRCAALLASFREELQGALRSAVSTSLSESASFASNEVVAKVLWDFETQLLQQKYSFMGAIASLEASGAGAAEEIQKRVNNTLLNQRKAAAKEAAALLHKERGEREAAEEARLAALMKFSNLSAETFFDLDKKSCLTMHPQAFVVSGIESSVRAADVAAVIALHYGANGAESRPPATPPVSSSQLSPRALSSQQSQRLAQTPRTITTQADPPPMRQEAVGFAAPLPFLHHPQHPQDLLRLVIGFLCELTLESVGYFVSVANEDLLKVAESRLAAETSTGTLGISSNPPPSADSEKRSTNPPSLQSPSTAALAAPTALTALSSSSQQPVRHPHPAAVHACVATLVPIQRLHTVGYYLDALEALCQHISSKEGLVDGLTDRDLGYYQAGGVSHLSPASNPISLATSTINSASTIGQLKALNSSTLPKGTDMSSAALAQHWWSSSVSRRPQMSGLSLNPTDDITIPPTDRESSLVGFLAEGILDRRIAAFKDASMGAIKPNNETLLGDEAPIPQQSSSVLLPLKAPNLFLTDHHVRQYNALIAVLSDGLAMPTTTRLADTYRRARERNQLRQQRGLDTSQKKSKKKDSGTRIGSISLNVYGGGGAYSPREPPAQGSSPRRSNSKIKLKRGASNVRGRNPLAADVGSGGGILGPKATMGPSEFSSHGRGGWVDSSFPLSVGKDSRTLNARYPYERFSESSASDDSVDHRENKRSPKYPEAGQRKRAKDKVSKRLTRDIRHIRDEAATSIERRQHDIPTAYYQLENSYTTQGYRAPPLGETAIEGKAYGPRHDTLQKSPSKSCPIADDSTHGKPSNNNPPPASQQWSTLGLNRTSMADIGTVPTSQDSVPTQSAFRRRQQYYEQMIVGGTVPKRNTKEANSNNLRKRVQIVYEEISSTSSGSDGEPRPLIKEPKRRHRRILYQDFFGYRSYTNPADDPRRRGSTSQNTNTMEVPEPSYQRAIDRSPPVIKNHPQKARHPTTQSADEGASSSQQEYPVAVSVTSVIQSKPYKRLQMQRAVLTNALAEVSGRCDVLTTWSEGLRRENAALRRKLRDSTGEVGSDCSDEDTAKSSEASGTERHGVSKAQWTRLAAKPQLSAALHKGSSPLPPILHHQVAAHALSSAKSSPIDKRFPLLRLPVLLNPMGDTGSPTTTATSQTYSRPVDTFLSFSGGKNKRKVQGEAPGETTVSEAVAISPFHKLPANGQNGHESDADEYQYVDTENLFNFQSKPHTTEAKAFAGPERGVVPPPQATSPSRNHHLAPLLGVGHLPTNQQAKVEHVPPPMGVPLMPLGSALSPQYRAQLEQQRTLLVGKLFAAQQKEKDVQ